MSYFWKVSACHYSKVFQQLLLVELSVITRWGKRAGFKLSSENFYVEELVFMSLFGGRSVNSFALFLSLVFALE